MFDGVNVFTCQRETNYKLGITYFRIKKNKHTTLEIHKTRQKSMSILYKKHNTVKLPLSKKNSS